MKILGNQYHLWGNWENSVFHQSFPLFLRLLKNHHFIEICSLQSQLKSTHFSSEKLYASSSVLIHDFLWVKQIIIYELFGFTDSLTFRLIIELVFDFEEGIFTVKGSLKESIDHDIVNGDRFFTDSLKVIDNLSKFIWFIWIMDFLNKNGAHYIFV